MKRAVFNPNIHGLAVWSETWAAEALSALERLTVEMKVRYPQANLVPGGSAVYAVRDDVTIGVAWIEPEIVDGRVVGVQQFIGAAAGSA